MLGPPSLRPVRRLVTLELWPLTTGAQAPSPSLSGFGFLRPACGTAVESVRISISVCARV